MERSWQLAEEQLHYQRLVFLALRFKQFLHSFPSDHFRNSFVIQCDLFFFPAVLSCVWIAVEISLNETPMRSVNALIALS